MVGRVLAVLLLFFMAGCGGVAADFTGNGVTSATEVASKECGTSGDVNVDTNGSGKVYITVSDGAGKVIYTKTIDGTGQNHDARSIDGVAGSWTLTARFSGNQYYPGGFSGQWNIGLAC